MNKQFRVVRAAFGAVVGLAAGAAMAAAPDVTATVTDIGAANTPIASIGVAVLGVLVGIMVFKWVRRAL